MSQAVVTNTHVLFSSRTRECWVPVIDQQCRPRSQQDSGTPQRLLWWRWKTEGNSVTLYFPHHTSFSKWNLPWTCIPRNSAENDLLIDLHPHLPVRLKGFGLTHAFPWSVLLWPGWAQTLAFLSRKRRSQCPNSISLTVFMARRGSWT